MSPALDNAHSGPVVARRNPERPCAQPPISRASRLHRRAIKRQTEGNASHPTPYQSMSCPAYFFLVDGTQTAVLALRPAAEHPTPASLERFAHEYSMQAELDNTWAVRPLELLRLREGGRILLVLEDSGGEPLDRLPRRWCVKTRSNRSW